MSEPRKVSHYEIKAELGRGGMAVVYRAYDPRFKRDAALKLLPREFLHDPTFRARFEREAQTIAALEHAAIVPVYDYGEEDGQPFLVMRYMAGGSLAERLKQGPLPPAETAQIVGRLAPALDKAHSRGIIHRDLKPGNILFDEDGEVSISDFGIAKITQEAANLTGSGTIVGTPAYMSPEQARAKGALDGRSDLYSLGVIVFEMLAGRLPYEADTPVGFLTAHVSEPVPNVLDFNPQLPEECETVLLRALAKDPASRYANVADFAADLGTALQVSLPTPPHSRPISSGWTPPKGSQAEVAAGPGTFPVTTPARRAVPVWAWIGGAMAAAALVVIGLIAIGALGGPPKIGALIPAGNGSVTVTPTADPNVRLGFHGNPVTRNADWKPVFGEFAGVKMALIPAGCFTMGSMVGASDEQPPNRQCFRDPFWIDVTEVTNKAFGSAGYFKGDNLPRESVTWSDSQEHCSGRDIVARLPTETEWEYAARGPDGLEYPWGDSFAASKVVYEGNSNNQTAEVGSKPDGASWVGALDMSGNVAEWMHTWYAPYPYVSDNDEQYGFTPPALVFPGHSTRGGGWSGPLSQQGFIYHDLRAASRGYGGFGDQLGPNFEYYTLGFRCARPFNPADLTPAATPNAAPTLIPSVQPTANPAAALGFPGHSVTRNSDWKPLIQEFNGVKMALVPVGCFTMGSDVSFPNERPANQQCFSQPFWIDLTEVTNAQFRAASDSTYADDALPRENITWLEASDFCRKREARLPTEAEWEYAGRGPDDLVYPWGNAFLPANVVFDSTSGGQTAPVGSRPGGASWVGTLDLLGNVGEFVSSLYKPYPFDAADGREVVFPTDNFVSRVVRGSSFSDSQSQVLLSFRNFSIATLRSQVYGFRCARTYGPSDLTPTVTPTAAGG